MFGIALKMLLGERGKYTGIAAGIALRKNEFSAF